MGKIVRLGRISLGDASYLLDLVLGGIVSSPVNLTPLLLLNSAHRKTSTVPACFSHPMLVTFRDNNLKRWRHAMIGTDGVESVLSQNIIIVVQLFVQGHRVEPVHATEKW